MTPPVVSKPNSTIAKSTQKLPFAALRTALSVFFKNDNLAGVTLVFGNVSVTKESGKPISNEQINQIVKEMVDNDHTGPSISSAKVVDKIAEILTSSVTTDYNLSAVRDVLKNKRIIIPTVRDASENNKIKVIDLMGKLKEDGIDVTKTSDRITCNGFITDLCGAAGVGKLHELSNAAFKEKEDAVKRTTAQVEAEGQGKTKSDLLSDADITQLYRELIEGTGGYPKEYKMKPLDAGPDKSMQRIQGESHEPKIKEPQEYQVKQGFDATTAMRDLDDVLTDRDGLNSNGRIKKMREAYEAAKNIGITDTEYPFLTSVKNAVDQSDIEAKQYINNTVFTKDRNIAAIRKAYANALETGISPSDPSLQTAKGIIDYQDRLAALANTPIDAGKKMTKSEIKEAKKIKDEILTQLRDHPEQFPGLAGEDLAKQKESIGKLCVNGSFQKTFNASKEKAQCLSGALPRQNAEEDVKRTTEQMKAEREKSKNLKTEDLFALQEKDLTGNNQKAMNVTPNGVTQKWESGIDKPKPEYPAQYPAQFNIIENTKQLADENSAELAAQKITKQKDIISSNDPQVPSSTDDVTLARQFIKLWVDNKYTALSEDQITKIAADGKISRAEAKELGISSVLFDLIDRKMNTKGDYDGYITKGEIEKFSQTIAKYETAFGFDEAKSISLYNKALGYDMVDLQSAIDTGKTWGKDGINGVKIETGAKIDDLQKSLSLSASTVTILKQRYPDGLVKDVPEFCNFLAVLPLISRFSPDVQKSEFKIKDAMTKKFEESVNATNLLSYISSGSAKEKAEGKDNNKPAEKKKIEETDFQAKCDEALKQSFKCNDKGELTADVLDDPKFDATIDGLKKAMEDADKEPNLGVRYQNERPIIDALNVTDSKMRKCAQNKIADKKHTAQVVQGTKMQKDADDVSELIDKKIDKALENMDEALKDEKAGQGISDQHADYMHLKASRILYKAEELAQAGKAPDALALLQKNKDEYKQSIDDVLQGQGPDGYNKFVEQIKNYAAATKNLKSGGSQSGVGGSSEHIAKKDEKATSSSSASANAIRDRLKNKKQPAAQQPVVTSKVNKETAKKEEGKPDSKGKKKA